MNTCDIFLVVFLGSIGCYEISVNPLKVKCNFGILDQSTFFLLFNE